MNLTKSVRNFIWLLGSSVAIKGVGILRESVVAYSVGNTMEFANFNSLRSIVDFFLAFVIGVPILESILVPKYAPRYLRNNVISFSTLWSQTKTLSVYLLLSGILALATYTYLKYDQITPNDIFWILLFSIYLAFNLSNSVLFSLQKATGNFKEYSSQSFYNALITLVFIFVLINVLGLPTIIIASLAAILVSNFLHKYSLRKHFTFEQDSAEQDEKISITDINLFKFISVNHAIFIGFAGRLIIGFQNDNQINLYQYSYIIISSFMLVIVSNISSVILYRYTTQGSNIIGKTLIITSIITLTVNISLYFFGSYLISILYQRGQFTPQDTADTFDYLKSFLIPYSLFAISQVMIQPFLSQHRTDNNKGIHNPMNVVGYLSIISIISSVILGFYLVNFRSAILFLLYFSSISITLYLSIKHIKDKPL